MTSIYDPAEYWINVYRSDSGQFLGSCWLTREDAVGAVMDVAASQSYSLILRLSPVKAIGRLHVMRKVP